MAKGEIMVAKEGRRVGQGLGIAKDLCLKFSVLIDVQNEGKECRDGGGNQDTTVKLGNTEQCPPGNTTTEIPDNSKLINGPYNPADQDSAVRVVDLQATLDKQVCQQALQLAHSKLKARKKKDKNSNESFSRVFPFLCQRQTKLMTPPRVASAAEPSADGLERSFLVSATRWRRQELFERRLAKKIGAPLDNDATTGGAKKINESL